MRAPSRGGKRSRHKKHRRGGSGHAGSAARAVDGVPRHARATPRTRTADGATPSRLRRWSGRSRSGLGRRVRVPLRQVPPNDEVDDDPYQTEQEDDDEPEDAAHPSALRILIDENPHDEPYQGDRTDEGAHRGAELDLERHHLE